MHLGSGIPWHIINNVMEIHNALNHGRSNRKVSSPSANMHHTKDLRSNAFASHESKEDGGEKNIAFEDLDKDRVFELEGNGDM